MIDVLTITLNLGAVYGLVAIGISLTWAGLGFLNLAHGVTFALAGYGAWLTAQHISSGGLAVVLGGVILGGVGGVIIFALVFLPLDGRPNWEMRSLVATLALMLLGQNALLQVFGSESRGLPPVFGKSLELTIGGTVITPDRTGAVLSAAVMLAAAILVLRLTRLGLGVRALAQNAEGAVLVGIDRARAALLILVLSGSLAGLASVLLAQTFYVSPTVGFVPLVKGFVVALLGGMGSMTGIAVAALLVGATEAITATYIGSQYVLIALFLMIVVVMVVRPRGIAGILEETRA